jgi:hypothetical protein
LGTAAGLWALASAAAGCRRGRALDALGIVPRAEWGAAPPDVAGSDEGPYDAATNPGGWYVYPEPPTEALNTLVVHHSALPLSDGPVEIQRKHLRRGFADIGYHFVIDAAGLIYAGRDVAARGAHTGGHNTGTLGVVLLGNFEERIPTEAQVDRLHALGHALREAYTLTHLAGHRDFQPGVTVCPGRHLETRLPALAEALKLSFGTAGYVGTPAAPRPE